MFSAPVTRNERPEQVGCFLLPPMAGPQEVFDAPHGWTNTHQSPRGCPAMSHYPNVCSRYLELGSLERLKFLSVIPKNVSEKQYSGKCYCPWRLNTL